MFDISNHDYQTVWVSKINQHDLATLVDLYEKSYQKKQTELKYNSFSKNSSVYHEKYEKLGEYKPAARIIESYFKQDVSQYHITAFEKTFANTYLPDNIHHLGSRLANVKPEKMVDLGDIMYTLLWHYDRMEYSNTYDVNVIIYLNDVDKDNGAFCYDANLAVAINNKEDDINYENLDSIDSAFVEGDAGTIMVFSTKLLHRLNLPKTGERKSVRFVLGFDK